MLTKSVSLLCDKFQGINRTSSSFATSNIFASDMENVELFNTGQLSGVGIRTMKGNTSVFTFNDEREKIINIYESIQGGISYCFIYTETNTEGKLYLFDRISSTVTLKKDNLSKTGVSFGVDFAQGWSDLFIFTNSKEILSVEIGHYNENQQLDEITVFQPVDVEGNSVEGFGLTVFDGRLWLFNKFRLWYSVKEDCYDFATSSPSVITSAGYIEFAKNITAITPYLGSLAVFSKDSSCLITVTEDLLYAKTDDSPGGCASYNSFVFHGTQLYFYDNTKKAIFAFSQIISGDKTLSDNIALDIQEELSAIPKSMLDNIKMLSVVQPDKNEFWMILPTDGSKTTILIYDYIHQQWVKRVSQKINALRNINGELLSVSDRKILAEYNGDTFDGEILYAYYKCSPLDLHSNTTLKVTYNPPRLVLDDTRCNCFLTSYNVDYSSTKTYSIKKFIRNVVKTFLYWDVSYWDSGVCYPFKESKVIKRLPMSKFRTIEIVFESESTSQEVQGFSVMNIEFPCIVVKQM